MPPLEQAEDRAAVAASNRIVAARDCLEEVRSELGLRQRGGDKVPPRDTRSREFEFFLVSQEADVVNQLFGEYVLRFDFAAKRIGLPEKTADHLQAALHEMAANAVTHAKAPVPALIGYEVRGHTATFCVVDVGIGVLESLHSNPAYRQLSVHSEAIRTALQDHVSCVVGDFSRGNGFRSVFKSLVEQYGDLRFRAARAVSACTGWTSMPTREKS